MPTLPAWLRSHPSSARRHAAGATAGGGDADLASRRLDLKLGYGLAAFGDRFTLTPELAAGLSDGGRDYRLGLRLTHAAAPFEIALAAARREAAGELRNGLTVRQIRRRLPNGRQVPVISTIAGAMLSH